MKKLVLALNAQGVGYLGVVSSRSLEYVDASDGAAQVEVRRAPAANEPERHFITSYMR
jgi:hypothetical protein